MCRYLIFSWKYFADGLACKAGSFPTLHLGILLCLGAASKVLWDPVLERKEKKLALWKEKYLSLGSHITLIKSVLSNLPIYFLLVFKCPSPVTVRTEKIQRDFLWQGKGDSKKIHLLKVEQSL